MSEFESKWIMFIKQDSTGKTKVYKIVPKDQLHTDIGLIKWYAPWRKYCFFAKANTIFETDCLSDIIGFIKKLMTEHKVEVQNRKTAQQ